MKTLLIYLFLNNCYVISLKSSFYKKKKRKLDVNSHVLNDHSYAYEIPIDLH